MAGIDKMYLSSWKDYSDFKKWCEEQPLLKDKYGNKERITEYLYNYDEEDFTYGELPVFKAPCYVDAYVIRNCPLDAMQSQLKLHYGDSYEDIKAGKEYTSPKEDYVCGTHFKMTYWPGKKYNTPIIGLLMVEVVPPKGFMWYNGITDTWDFPGEYVKSSCGSSAAHVKTIRALKRKLRKWKLPVGTLVEVSGRYVGEVWKFVIKP